jgi:superfamily II DNA or RNA helicase
MKTKELTKNEMVLINQNPLNARIIVWFYTHCGYAPYQYQIDKIVDLFNEFKKTGKIPKIVLAAAPNAGKTNMSICFIDLLLEDNPNLRTLILVHNTSILRKNYFDRILLLKPKFVLTAQNLKAGDEFDENSNVVVTMPSTIQQRKILPEFDILIVDEAHHFYESKDKRTKERGGTMIQKIIKKINPKYHILLTGTPSIFIKLGGYKILSITGMEIYEAGNSAEVYVEHSTSSYFVRNTDFTKGSDDVKIGFKFDVRETEKSLEDVVKKIYHRLLSFRNPKQNSLKQLISPVLDWEVFKFNLKRTIIACRNIQQAHVVAKYFIEKGIKTIQSDYESDTDNKLIEKFLEDKTYKILVVVQKGVLGLDDETIEIAVDMTLSKNIDRIFQFYNRVTRKLEINGKRVKKLFIKIVPSNRVDEYKIRLTGVICMMHKEWYTKFNGKNFLDMKLPKESKPSGGTGTSGGAGTGGGNKPKGQEYLGIPAPENMFQYLTSEENF